MVSWKIEFVEDGLIFKLASDVHGLYGGNEYARFKREFRMDILVNSLTISKAAKHELKGLNELGKIIIGQRVLKDGVMQKTSASVKGIFIPLV